MKSKYEKLLKSKKFKKKFDNLYKKLAQKENDRGVQDVKRPHKPTKS